jgi:enoyl-CoA hydratase/carnithine racemase
MLILTPDDLERSDVEAIAARRDCVVAVGAGELRGCALAVALHSDFLALDQDATVRFPTQDSRLGNQDFSPIWSGAIGRIGHGALRLFLLSGEILTADDAVHAGLADAVVPAGKDPLEWIREWLAGRSTAALDSAAALIRQRGGDGLERAEFARLFATGEPQEGLTAFLAKRRADFGREITSLRGDQASRAREEATSKPEKR